MTDHSPRLFATAAEIRRLGEGLIACTLERARWTHEAHLGATLYLVVERPDLDLDAELPGFIRRFNESVGGKNTATEGYHHTITLTYLSAIRDHARETEVQELRARTNALLLSERGRRDWPLRFYTAERLFSPEARLTYVPPEADAMSIPSKT
ncbi:hypothetical protein HJG53_01070 [Sphingomonas sp. ID1715]|uniref:hypothetical protein n=1 Tax=Sphingomonas sp. ID1715 TaxID=1656898 RepID=UPI001488D392|nr:hypothetical protein [Sphingomonas sp. ID1715]NNM75500.1 hypothetical protein [Sphingomonas sp. ID1715]